MSLLDFIFDRFTSTEIDLYFILSDLKEMSPLSFAEKMAHKHGNASTNYQHKNYDLTNPNDVQALANDAGIPVGKMVL